MAALRAPVSECAPARSGGTTARTRPTACHPRFARRGWRVARLRFNAAGRGPTLLPFLAPQRGMRSTSCCHPAAVEGVGWVFGTWLFFGARTAGEGWGPRQTRAHCQLHCWQYARVNRAISGPLLFRGCLGTGCCASSAAAQRVPTADCPAIAGLVSHLLLRDVRCGRVGKGAGAFLLSHQLPNRLLQMSNR